MTTTTGAAVDCPAELAVGVTLWARYYHPELRRFVSEDLIGFLPHALTVVDWMAPRELWSASPA